MPAALYLGAVAALRRREVRWGSSRRTVWFLVGVALLALALLPPLAAHDEVFTDHMVQHLLLGMFAPVFLALSAPVTLALRVVRPSRRRLVMGILHSLLARPASATLDWELDGPAGKPIEIVRGIRDDIGRRVHALLAELVPATSEA